MSSQANLQRFDLSPYLIHFFRPVDQSSLNGPSLPESWGFNNCEPDTEEPFSPLFMLRCAVRNTNLWATWSVRKGFRTIYGDSPAVCFTEMPIAAFLESGAARQARGENMSPYGLVFPKDVLFARGARQVIYGLSDPGSLRLKAGCAPARIIEEDMLPLLEQYRYVTYAPGAYRPIDWTHEREWRWPYRDSAAVANFEQYVVEGGTGPDASLYPGFSFAGGDINGMGAIVKTAEEAQLLTHDILTLADRGVIGREQFAFILCADELPTNVDLRDPQAVAQAISDAAIDIAPYFVVDDERALELTNQFKEIVAATEGNAGEVDSGERGGCWLWFSDNTHELTRALIATKCITVTRDGRYLVSLPEFDERRSLQQREEMTKTLSEQIEERFGIPCSYFSILGKYDPNEVPFFTDPDMDWPFYNKA